MGIIFGGAYLPSYGGKFAFQINRASLIVGSKFTVFALFFFVYEGNFSSTGPRGAYIWRGDLMEGFLRYRSWGLILLYLEGLIYGGAYFWNFMVDQFSPRHSGLHGFRPDHIHMGHLPQTTQFVISNLEQSLFSVHIIDNRIKFHTRMRILF